MRQEITVEEKLDLNGNPTGGKATGIGISINWQDGPLGRGENRQEPNGAFVEGVIQAAICRMEFFEASKFACRENALALTKLQEALMWLDERTRGREVRKVEGEHKV